MDKHLLPVAENEEFGDRLKFTTKIKHGSVYLEFEDSIIRKLTESEFRNSSESMFILCQVKDQDFQRKMKDK